jgi:hypothetical protein
MLARLLSCVCILPLYHNNFVAKSLSFFDCLGFSISSSVLKFLFKLSYFTVIMCHLFFRTIVPSSCGILKTFPVFHHILYHNSQVAHMFSSHSNSVGFTMYLDIRYI